MTLKEELERIFDDSIEEKTQQAFIKCLFSSYKGAHDECFKKFAHEEAHDLLPFYRWIQLRSELKGLEGRFEKIETFHEPNGPAPSYHIIINTERVILTVSSVQAPGALPRPAIYRTEMANKHQLSFDFMKSDEDSRKVYAILLHGVKRDDKKQPAFAEVGFPAKGFEYYIHRIDLFKKFDVLVKTLSSRPEEIAKPALREPVLEVTKKLIGER